VLSALQEVTGANRLAEAWNAKDPQRTSVNKLVYRTASEEDGMVKPPKISPELLGLCYVPHIISSKEFP
jgi:hypothetical protein